MEQGGCQSTSKSTAEVPLSKVCSHGAQWVGVYLPPCLHFLLVFQFPPAVPDWIPPPPPPPMGTKWTERSPSATRKVEAVSGFLHPFAVLEVNVVPGRFCWVKQSAA